MKPQFIAVFGSENSPQFTYTINMFEYIGAELIVLGLPHQHVTLLMEEIIKKKKEGASFNEPMVIETFGVSGDDEARIKFRLVKTEMEGDICVQQAINAHGHSNFPVYQIILCDRNGKFDDEEGYIYFPQILLPQEEIH